MSAQITQRDLIDLLPYLNTSLDELQSFRRAQFDAGKTMLEQWKERIRKAYKGAARALHPDLNNGDKAKSDLLVRLNQLMPILETLQLRAPAPPPVQWTISVTVDGSVTTTGWTPWPMNWNTGGR